MTHTLTPAAERKRQQRARAAAGQVHRVAVYLTDEEAGMVDVMASLTDQSKEDAIRSAIEYGYETLSSVTPRQTPPSNP